MCRKNTHKEQNENENKIKYTNKTMLNVNAVRWNIYNILATNFAEKNGKKRVCMNNNNSVIHALIGP